MGLDGKEPRRSMDAKAFQDYYTGSFAYCYGCGRLNPDGLQIKTHWEGEESVTRFTPRPHHIAITGYVYGGLIASLIDCHGTGTAAGAVLRAGPSAPGPGPARPSTDRGSTPPPSPFGTIQTRRPAGDHDA